MRLSVNLSAILLSGSLATAAALTQGGMTQAASMPRLVSGAPAAADMAANVLLVKHAGSVETHFAAANTSHDGHLTKPQAEQAGWTRVAKRFDDIDLGHKGWVSVDEIHDFNKSHRKHHAEAAS